MAFITSPLPQEQQNQFGVPGTTSPNPLALLPPQAGGSAGAGTGGTTPDKATPTQFGAPASKLSDYLSANQDQTQALGGKIAGDLGTQFTQTQGAVDQAAQGFGQQVSQSYTPYNADVVNQAKADPAQFAAKPENVDAFKAQLNDQYTGPANFESSAPYANVQNQVQRAVQNADLLKTPSGLSTYLGNTAKGTYTPGMQTLDSSLVAGNAPAYQQITEAAKPFAGLSKYLGDATASSNALIPQAQQAATQAKTSAQGAISGAAADLNGKVQTALNDAIKKYGQNGTFQSIQQTINSGNTLSPEQATILGIDPAGYQKQLALAQQTAQLYNNFKPSLSDYFTPGDVINTPPSAANVASPDMFATAKALSLLSGNDAGNLGLSLNPADESQAGTFTGSAAAPKLDLGKAQTDIHDAFSGADRNAWDTWWRGRFLTGGDPWSQIPSNIQNAGLRLKGGGAGLSTAGYVPVGFNSNPDVY